MVCSLPGTTFKRYSREVQNVLESRFAACAPHHAIRRAPLFKFAFPYLRGTYLSAWSRGRGAVKPIDYLLRRPSCRSYSASVPPERAPIRVVPLVPVGAGNSICKVD